MARTPLKRVTGFRLETLTHPLLPGMGPGRGDPERTNFVLHEFGVAAGRGEDAASVKLVGARADFSQETASGPLLPFPVSLQSALPSARRAPTTTRDGCRCSSPT